MISRLVKISVLIHRDAVGKVIALKCILHEEAVKGQRLFHARSLRWSALNSTSALEVISRFTWPLIDLHNHALPIEQECDGNRQVSAPVEEMAVDDVVDAGNFIAGKQQSGM